jgi:hypothetical protein
LLPFGPEPSVFSSGIQNNIQDDNFACGCVWVGKVVSWHKGGTWTEVLGRIFEPKRDEVTGEWRKLHN